MAQDTDKNWNRPWSMEEIIENAETWSLAGDVALLNTIKAYADNLLTKTMSISDNVDYLLNDLNEVSLKLEISHNEFQSLRNTQFIESRVYEDDETLGTKVEPKEEEKAPTENEKHEMVREAVLEGLKVMDKYFDKIEVSLSDSEEESEKSYILQPKDLYADRPLPLVIGTEDWYKKWHAGLAETSSEDESDKGSEIYSDSDSDDHLPKDLLTKGSETSSELDFSSQTSESRPAANSTFKDSTRQPDIFESDDNEEEGSLPVKIPIANKNFAEQLAEKLGNVISEREDVPVDINKRPIQPAKPNQFTGNLFSDEPPPLDDLDDTILPKSAQSGLFSGGQGLFDDNEDELFWGQQNNAAKMDAEAKKVENKREILPEVVKSISSLPKSSQVSKGLFDSDDSSDDDLFASNKKQLSKPPFLQPFKTTAPLFDEEPPELDTQKKTVQQPQNKAEVPKNTDEKSTNQQENIEKPKKISLFDDNPELKLETSQENTGPKKINLFDDDDDLFRDNLFSTATPNKPISKLLDKDEDMKPAKGHLFENEDTENINKEQSIDQKKTNKPKKVVSLFSDAEEEEDEEKELDTPKIKNDDLKDKTSEEDAGYKDSKGDLSERQVIGAEKKVIKGLFDDEDGDLFKNAGIGSPSREPPQLQVTVPTPQARKTEGISLFGSTPPPDDDDWDVKSDNFSDNEDLFSYRAEGNAAASSLFDNEPPSLGPNESSGIVRDQNVTRVDTDDSSFYPYASSSRRLSSDIFSEQQSQDSLFITKSKTESTSILFPPLDIIPEQTKVSHIDITPSGNPSDLEDTTGKSLTTDSVFEETEAEKSKKPVSLFDDYDDSEDLFGTGVATKTLPRLSEKRQSLFGDVLNENILKTSSEAFKNTETISNDSPKKGETDKVEVKSSPEKSRIANLIDQIQSEPAKEQPTLPISSPRRLKHNLNINVNALLPGFTPKMKDLSKSQSLDLPKDRGDTLSDTSTPDAAFFTPPSPLLPKRDSDTGSEKTVSFEDALDNVEVLHSITKDRVKIPIKRRPSTRRGRREAITKSAGDLSTDSGEVPVFEQDKPSEIGGGDEKIAPLVVEIESSKKEANEPPKETTINQSEKRNVQKPKVRDIFGGDGDSDEDLFPNLAAKTTEATKNKAKSTIFDSEDSDSDLFGKPGSKSNSKGGKTKKSDTKKSLFNDSSSDEDLFSSNKSSIRKNEQPKVVGKKPHSSTLRKLKNIETDDDPLSSLLK